MASNFKLSKSSSRNIKDVSKFIKTLINRVLKKSEEDFGIPQYGGKRTPQEQNNLYHQIPKVTQLDGFKNESVHQYGWAWDIFMLDGKKACWDDCIDKYKYIHGLFKEEFELMKSEGLIDESAELIWGGDWIRFKDLPHHEILF